jgi:aminoglycoside 3-N-acetyltransferase
LELFVCNNKSITYGDILDSLLAVDADQCDVLLLHTAMKFGTMAKGLKRTELCRIMYDIICQLGVKTLIFPTFTFSFANKEDYDVCHSRSYMGILNEYVRKREDSIRSMDPLLSVCVIGENKSLAESSGDSSMGKGSFYDRLHNTDNVRIAFLGADELICNTHLHYVEECVNVPYRYHLSMTGNIIDPDGNARKVTQKLFVTYRDVITGGHREFYDELISENRMKKVFLGESSISCFREPDIYEHEKKYLKKDINYFLAEPYDTHPLVKEFEYGGVVAVK